MNNIILDFKNEEYKKCTFNSVDAMTSAMQVPTALCFLSAIFVGLRPMVIIVQGFPKKTPVSQKSKIFLIYSVMIGKVK